MRVGSNSFDISQILDARMDALDLTPTQLARLSGVSDTHIINLRSGAKRAGYDTVRKLAPHLGVAVADLTREPPTGPEPIGEVGAFGLITLRVAAEGKMSGLLLMVEPAFGLEAGHFIQCVPGEFEPGKLLIVNGVEGTAAIVRAVVEDGKPWLETGRGDLIKFRPEAHAVLGQVFSSTRYFW